MNDSQEGFVCTIRDAEFVQEASPVCLALFTWRLFLFRICKIWQTVLQISALPNDQINYV